MKQNRTEQNTHNRIQHSEPSTSTTQHNRVKTGQRSAAQHSTAQHSTAQRSTARQGTAQRSTARHGKAQRSAAQHSTARHSSTPGSSRKLNMTEPVSGSTLSAEPELILVTATVVLATAAVLGLENANPRANPSATSLQLRCTLQLSSTN